MNAHSTSPDAFAVFYPYKRETTRTFRDRNPSPSVFMETTEVKVRNEIISINTQKTKGSSGTFQIMLAGTTNWKAKIHKGAWCFIHISNEELTGKETNEADGGLKMVGIVRSIRRVSRTMEDGKRLTRYMIIGEDFHHFLNNTIYLNINLSNSISRDQLQSALVTLKNDPEFGGKLTPAKMARIFYRNMLGLTKRQYDPKTKTFVESQNPFDRINTNNPVRIPAPVYKRIYPQGAPGDLFYSDFVQPMFQDDLPGQLIAFPGIGSNPTTFGLIQNFTNSLVNELYTEMLPLGENARLTPAFILRNMPFSSNPKDKKHASCIAFQEANRVFARSDRPYPHFYTSKVIHESEIFEENMGLSDAELFNFFFVPPSYSPQQSQNEITLLHAIRTDRRPSGLVDLTSMERYGSKPFVGSTMFFHNDGGVASGFLFTEMAMDFFKLLHIFENGTVQIAGSKDYIPVGTNVLFKERKWIGHIEGVQHQYFVLGNGTKRYRTTLMLTRVQREDGQPISHIDIDIRNSEETFPGDRGVSTNDG